MVDPFSTVGSLIKGILECHKEVKMNRKQCDCLVLRVKHTDRMVQVLKDKADDPSVQYALGALADALEDAQAALEQCCQTMVGEVIHVDEYARTLKIANEKLDQASSLFPIACPGMLIDISSEVIGLRKDMKESIPTAKADVFKSLGRIEQALKTEIHTQTAEIPEIKNQVSNLAEQLSSTKKELIDVINGHRQEATPTNQEG